MPLSALHPGLLSQDAWASVHSTSQTKLPQDVCASLLCIPEQVTLG